MEPYIDYAVIWATLGVLIGKKGIKTQVWEKRTDLSVAVCKLTPSLKRRGFSLKA